MDKRKILVIDDDESLRELFTQTLKAHYEVSCAGNGAQGLETARREVPDLILCDMIMPELTGAEVLREMAIDPTLFTVPVVMMTANPLDEPTRGLFQQHPNVRGCLQKPLPLAELLGLVQTVLGPRREARAPAPAPASAPTWAPPKPKHSGKQYSLLVVDDDLSFYQLLSLVAHRDDKIVRVNDGTEALDQLKRYKPDLMFVELLLPKMSGLELLRAMQKDPARKFVPVILASGAKLTGRQIAFLQKEFPNLKVVLAKPSQIPDLRDSIESILLRDLV